jgi:hypothetical protein
VLAKIAQTERKNALEKFIIWTSSITARVHHIQTLAASMISRSHSFHFEMEVVSLVCVMRQVEHLNARVHGADQTKFEPETEREHNRMFFSIASY